MTRWPIVVHRTIGSPSDAEADALILRAEQILSRGEKHAIVFENLLAESPSPYMRQRSVEWLTKNGERMSKHCVGTALVFRTAAMRFVMSGVMLFVTHPTPHSVVGTLDQGLAWCRDQLALPTQRAAGQR
jgi:hypothetical protein